MEYFSDYFNSPITSGIIDISDLKKYHSERKKSIHLRNDHLFLRAAQNLQLMKADVDFSRNSQKYQRVSITHISSIVSEMQKEIDFIKLNSSYNEKLQIIQDAYQKKVDFYQEKTDFSQQTNLILLQEINMQADEAEKEANDLKIAERENEIRSKKGFKQY